MPPENDEKYEAHARSIIDNAYDNMSPEELRAELKTLKMLLLHKEVEFEHDSAKINYSIGYIRQKLSDTYNDLSSPVT